VLFRSQETLEEGITKPSTMIPLLLPGAGARAGMRLVPEAWRWVGRVGGEAATQTAAELGGRAIETGQAPSFKDIATTTAWNLAPQAGEELLRAVPRTVLRSGQGARTILSDVAAQESKGLGRRVFHPEDEQVLSKMFEDVKASGVKLDIDPVTDLMASLTPTQRCEGDLLTARDSAPADRAARRAAPYGLGYWRSANAALRTHQAWACRADTRTSGPHQ